MSKLLINEYPLMVLPQLASLIGLNEAIFIQQLHYWLSKENAVEKDGQRWSFHTYDKWLKQFPFWSHSTLKRIVRNLKEINLLLVEQFKSHNSDHTNWYSIDYGQLALVETRLRIINQEEEIEEKLSTGQNDLIDQTIHQQVKLTPSRSAQNDPIEGVNLTRSIEKETKHERDLKKQQHVVVEKKINQHNQNPNPTKTQNLNNKAKKLNIPQYTLDELVECYGGNAVEEKLILLGNQKGVLNVVGWLKAALSKDYQQSKTILNPNEPCRGIPDIQETDTYLNHQHISLVPKEQKVKIMQDMKKLINNMRK